ncbi:hypothetical protein ACWGPC_56270, partial [Streptomyces mirabilis]
TEAMRNVPPRLAGAASGVNNTVRQIGSVIGAAAVGALVQGQLSAGVSAGRSYSAAFLSTLHSTAALPVAVLTAGLLACLLIRNHTKPRTPATAPAPPASSMRRPISSGVVRDRGTMSGMTTNRKGHAA